ncbi:hypothetical protein [Neptuniibacter halophilus]|uniref:hypothetical protein n=1 Tax=Neptuniibacter halophilus TaxID=651666 RepID=UPI002572E7FD|nr:hypothetical protein [Neptuniibacter halophilus]
MTEDELISRLRSLSSEQLDAIHDRLMDTVKQKEAKKAHLTKLPPRTSNDLEALADLQGLDLSSLLREAKRYS